jgi:hypothetical protein
MMNSFEKCRQLESQSVEKLLPILQEKFDEVISTDTFNNWRHYQEFYGDFLCIKNGKSYWVELKCEQSNKWKNFYFETWSNYPHNLGWFNKCKADYLLYHFLDDDICYIMDYKKIKEQVLSKDFPEKKQTKHQQKNVAYGLCVPINQLEGITCVNV